MKYYVISTSKSGHGAVFTNAKEAKEYQKNHEGSAYQVFDTMPPKIPPIGETQEKPEATSKKSLSGEIVVYTDGSALGNPGPGGYGVVIIFGSGEIEEYSQGYKHTTNNRMEMMAVMTALETLKDFKNAPITIHSDSQYTLNGITKGWAIGWRKRGWKKADGKPALNSDLWAAMLDLLDHFSKLKFQWVRGHAGNALNERADDLANGAAQDGIDMRIDEGYVR